MTEQRLREILERFSEAAVLVLGDFFLDQYLVIDPRLSEVSLETGLEARQVVEVRNSPGAAGTIASNLASLGLKQIEAIGIVGQDGAGFELMRALQAQGIHSGLMIESRQRRTPTYTKPMRLLSDGAEQEMNRLDIKNRTDTSLVLQEAVLGNLEIALTRVDAVIIADQVQEENCGVITTRVREKIGRTARENPDRIFFADSRTRVGKFWNVMIKPNEKEAREAVGSNELAEDELLRALHAQSSRPVFLTKGALGISVFDGREVKHAPALPVSEPIDPVGAGDSATAAIVASLCAGATLWEAAEIANLVASVTIRKLGATGAATCAEVLGAFQERN